MRAPGLCPLTGVLFFKNRAMDQYFLSGASTVLNRCFSSLCTNFSGKKIFFYTLSLSLFLFNREILKKNRVHENF
jgi:hypothetical protein